jgi:outer membrane protein assembly factor BamB
VDKNGMMERPGAAARRQALTRRAALLAPLALGGCGLFDDWFGTTKKPLPGKREAVLPSHRGLDVDEGVGKVVLPPPVQNAAWPQAGGNPAHLMGHLATAERLSRAWTSDIGAGGGYRRKILAQPVVADGVVYTMDSSAVVRAFKLSDGSRLWRFDTKPDDIDSTNTGGGLSVEGGVLYATNGVADVVAIDAAKGTMRWRQDVGVPVRSAPTVADGRLFLITIEDRLVALATDDGRTLWSHQASVASTEVLGRPAPAYSQGLVVAGFGSGELAAFRADSGSLTWTDSLGAARSRNSLADFSSIRGLPVINNGQVFAISLGGLCVGLDLPTGRRLWERQVAGEDSLWIAGDWMFLVSSSQDIAAVSVADGRVAWVSALPRWDDPEKQKDGLTWYGPVLAGDRLVVTGTSGEALAISPYNGEILGRQDLSDPASPVGPVVADGTLLLISDDGKLTALR